MERKTIMAFVSILINLLLLLFMSIAAGA